MSTFDKANAEQLIYNNTLLILSVLGGIRLDSLDRMRVTLKVELPDSPRPPLRHNIDLYNDTQVEKFIRKIADRLEVGTAVAEASLSELTAELENYRMQEIKKSNTKNQTSKILTETEKAEAIDFLTAPNLMERTNDLIGQSGILGEEINRLIMYVIFTSRKRSHPLHVVSLGASGTGKTHLQEKVGELIPEEDKIEITTLSENAFYYFERRALSHKLILIEDLDGLSSGASGGGAGGSGSLYALRELQSKKRISKTIAQKNTKGETRTINLVVEGPVSVSGCTTKEYIYEDNANRSFLLYLDESELQDQRVMDYQRALSAGKINQANEHNAQQLLRNCQRLLEPVKVINPYAELLHIPTEVFKPRRTNSHYLQFIEAVTFYHQKQRTEHVDQATGETYIETTLDDIEEANRLLKHILLRKSDQLTGACRNHFESLKLYLIGEKNKKFGNAQISRLFRIPLTTVKRHHLELAINGYLTATKLSGSKAFVYEVVSYEEYQQLQQRIETVLDQGLDNLKKQLNKGFPVVSDSRSHGTGTAGKAVLQGQKPSSQHQPTNSTEPIKTPKTQRKTTTAH